jgi:flagellar protein FlaG
MDIGSLGKIKQHLPVSGVRTVEEKRINPPHGDQAIEKHIKAALETENDATRIEELVEKTNRAMKNLGQMMHFDVHKESERLFVTIVEIKSEKVLKTIPSKEFLDLVARIQESVGLIIDEKM